MEIFLNRLDICFNNAVLTKKVDQKEKILNKVLMLIRYSKMTTDLINHLYIENPEMFLGFINNLKKPSLVLLTYDLEAIGKAIHIPDEMYIVINNNTFHLDFKPTSPNSDSSTSIHSEWGY